jgi:hypothetical protein
VTAEATLREAVLKRIREDYPRRTSGVLVFGRPASGATGPGHPDLFGVVVGRFIALEIKVLKSKPTDLQVQRIKDLRQAGAYAWIVRTPLEATRAVYQAKLGVHRVMPDDAIDFDDWFKEIISTTPSATTGTPIDSTPMSTSIADQAAPSTEADAVSLDEATDLAAEAAAQPTVEAERPRRGRRPKVDPRVAKGEAEVAALEELPSFDLGPTADDLAQAEPDPDASSLIEVMKTIGDRVTMVFEAITRMEIRLDKLQADFNTLLEDED